MKHLKLFENYENIEFQYDNTGYHHGQYDNHIDMLVNGETVAYADYTIYNDEITIKYVESLVKGKGYGQAVMKELARKYGYENLERTSLTPDGAKMRDRLDKLFDFDYVAYKDNQNKHFKDSDIQKIKNTTIREFIIYMNKYGYSKAWEVYMKNPEFKILIDQIDMNDVSEISEWSKGSVNNDNFPDVEPPEWVQATLNKLTA